MPGPQTTIHNKKLLPREVLDRKFWTTSMMATVCDVAPRTVGKWFDMGLLDGHRLPNVRDCRHERRIPRESAISFMIKHGFDTSEILGQSGRILSVGLNKVLLDDLSSQLDGEFTIENVGGIFEAGMVVTARPPGIVILSESLGQEDTQEVTHTAGKMVLMSSVRIIILGTDDYTSNSSRLSENVYYLNQPVTADRICSVIAEIDEITQHR